MRQQTTGSESPNGNSHMQSTEQRQEVGTMKRSRTRGQSIAEYAMLFAIVLGAIVVAQQYVKNRLAATIEAHTNRFVNVADDGTAIAATPVALIRGATSESASDVQMGTARTGTVTSNSTGHSATTY